MSDQPGNVSRRLFLKGSAGAAAIAGFGTLFGISNTYANTYANDHDSQDEVSTVLNLAATAETLAASSYYSTIKGNPFGLSERELLYLKYAMSSELYHLSLLESLGGQALTQQFYIPEKFLTDFGVNTNTFIQAETAFVGAYLAATRRMAEINEPRLAATTAQFVGTEAEHLALTRQIGGFLPNPNGLPAPIYYNVSDAVGVLNPFLEGGAGFIGPVSYPGADAINALLGDNKALEVPPFISVF